MSSDLETAQALITEAWQGMRDLADELDAEGNHERAQRERNIAAGFAASVMIVQRLAERRRGPRAWIGALKKLIGGGE